MDKKVRLKAIFIILIAMFLIYQYQKHLNSSVKPDKNSNYDVQKLIDAGFIYGFTYPNSKGLEKFCKSSGYVPKKHIIAFEDNFENTISYADEIIDEAYSKKAKKKLIKINMPKTLKHLENNYNIYKNQNANATKKDFCMEYDKNSDEIILERIKVFKKHRNDLFKD